MPVKFSAGAETVELSEPDAQSLLNLVGFPGPLREEYRADELKWNLSHADFYSDDPSFDVEAGLRDPFDVDVIYTEDQVRSLVSSLAVVAEAAGVDGMVSVDRTPES